MIDAGSPDQLAGMVDDLAGSSGYTLFDTMENLEGHTNYLLGNDDFQVLLMPEPFCASPRADVFYAQLSVTAAPPNKVHGGLEREGARLRRFLEKSVIEDDERLRCEE